ncbi:nuclear transport factor 2 family protein [Sphingobium sp. SA2]|uniref:nuclear transport factor 2 family protein n=1 Tax=Sphingobium sp. SA2 TaxID=1524832 RepID=UPI0028C0CAB7|nr:nuclear transport factor 2 family protein [Sphingobium sp. SA2]MDT7532094.1 nuclear transport factor 2 family protein [Sphingobium sp. SA2]
MADGEAWRPLADRMAIGDCLARLARGEDRRDAALIRACFWPDATVDYGIFAGDFDAYLAWVVPGSDAIAVTQHILGQSLIQIDGDVAKIETHVSAYHRIDAGEGARDMWLGGRYLDAMARRTGVWRIAKRTMLYDWCQDAGAAADWSQGLMGMPFSAPHFTGRVAGDFSDMFFAQAD